MFNNICQNSLVHVLNAVRHIAEGRPDALQKERYSFEELKKYLAEAKKRSDFVQEKNIIELLKIELLLGFNVSDASFGRRLLHIADGITEENGSLLIPYDHVLEPLERWMQSPIKDEKIERLLERMFEVNWSMPDDSPSALKLLVA